MKLKDKYRIKMDNPEDWLGYTMKPNKIEGTSIRFYHTNRDDFDKTNIDSLIQMELNSVNIKL
ncbi:hypothetical protein OO013_07760 [Mangrovivirga sp. M17]|uniref:Uncharacterized protein n=1 Tax=Mangrovivirga halotolerans TaxID=2993936 RepID=A0ABT3RRE0_9BACT|nr:hypothetical protein [Mangrovivirga halotolerans]MCX2743755.1 hypothetical protein [Mangrovivirga halotolerans]